MPGPVRRSTCNLCSTEFSAGSGELFVKDGYSIVRCPSCQLVFRATLPTAEELTEIYGEAYFGAGGGEGGRDGYLDYVGDEEVHRVNARRRLDSLAGLTTPVPLLDVGAAAGFFVDEATRRGWQARGVDVSSAMVEWGRRHTGADLLLGGLRDAPADREESCITMWDFIEHSIDPRGDVEHAFGRLRPGGVLALSTGNADSALARISLERWHLMTPRHHNFFFSRRTIVRLLRATGFEVVSVRHSSALFPLWYVAHKACLIVDRSIVDAAARRLARSRLGGRNVPLNLWDVMTVLARRPATNGGAR
jgi:2-polyprenyl-3-methyl-5-hydroxy-6-metoxy-1,4-benzoquinol methylase